jgi:hypothetical protein
MLRSFLKKHSPFSSWTSWQALHDRRRMSTSELNSRNTLTLAFGGALLALLLAALSLKAIGVKDWKGLVADRKDFHLLNNSQYQLSGVMPRQYSCAKNCGSLGVPLIVDEARAIKSPSELDDLTISRSVALTSTDERYWALLKYSIDQSAFLPLLNGRPSVSVSLHQLSYRMASVTVNGTPWGVFTADSPIRLILPTEQLRSGPVLIQVTYSVNDKGVSFNDREEFIPPFVASPNDVTVISAFEANSRQNNGAIVALMSRVLIAVFALMLFLFLDSAPETLGLALFLGFEALAMGIGQEWISLHWNPFVINYCYQMGDIFRLYFFLQLARVIKPGATKWLFYGTLLSIPYGIAKQMETRWGIEGLAIIPRFRDSFAGTVGALACLRTLWGIRRLHLPWRRVALVLGALGSIQQVLSPLTHYLPHLTDSTAFQGFYLVFEALSVYVLALATFTNISTLENRVKQMSTAKVRSDLIEQEMELGRSVQKAFLNIPKMPREFEVVAIHEAAVYVSGDLYFVDWDEIDQRLVVLISDVTGHGVQASLKAVACFMVARTLWAPKQAQALRNEFSSPKSKFATYHRQSEELLSAFGSVPDIPAFGGIEFYPRQQRAFLYRSNFHLPLIVEPNDSGGWAIVSHNIQVGESVSYRMKPGTLIAFFSDGFVDGSRQYSRLAKFVGHDLAGFDGKASTLRNLFTAFNDQNTHRPNDDRTLIVVSWKREEYLNSIEKSA